VGMGYGIVLGWFWVREMRLYTQTLVSGLGGAHEVKKKKHTTTSSTLEPTVTNSVPVPSGTAGMPRAGVQTGTEEAPSRTGQDTGRFQPFRAGLRVPSMPVPSSRRKTLDCSSPVVCAPAPADACRTTRHHGRLLE